MNKVITNQTIITKKGTRFPGRLLSSVIEDMRDIRGFGRNVTDHHIAGDGSTISGSFLKKKAALGYFGLISKQDDHYQITDLAEKILYPSSEEEKQEAIIAAFLSPTLYKQLYDSVEKNQPIKVELLGNVIVREYGVSAASRNECVSIFIKSGIFASLIAYVEGTKHEVIFKPIPVRKSILNDNTNINQVHFVEKKVEEIKPQLQTNGEHQLVEIKLTNGIAKISVPSVLSPEDTKKLQLQITILANIVD
jgi:hypothetical protein